MSKSKTLTEEFLDVLGNINEPFLISLALGLNTKAQVWAKAYH